MLVESNSLAVTIFSDRDVGAGAIAGGVVAVMAIAILVLTVVVIMLALRLRKRSNKNAGIETGKADSTVMYLKYCRLFAQCIPDYIPYYV